MGEQFHNPNYIPAVPNRAMANYFHYIAAAPRIDNLHQGTAGNQMYYTRPQEPPQQFFRPPFLYPMPPILPEPQLMVNHDEYSNIPINYSANASYSLMQTLPSLPSTIPLAHRFVIEPLSRPETRPLIISDPKTKKVINLSSPESEPPEDSSDNTTRSEYQVEEKVPVPKEPVLAHAKSDQSSDPPSITIDTELTGNDPNTQPCSILEDTGNEDRTVVENGVVVVDEGLITVEEVDKVDHERSESDSSAESDDNDTDAYIRRTYSREFMLACKESPPKELPQFSMDYLYRSGPRMHRGAHKTQRVIRLPVGATVKRSEDAFVPTQLRKKAPDNANDTKKVLSQELSIMLNKLSASNLQDTVNDIKNSKISSLDDIFILAELTFQKAIHQAKFSQLFALLCKELKGFSVGGSDPFESLVLRHVQELFHTPLDTVLSKLNNLLDTRIAESKDEDIKKLLEDDRESILAKKTDAYYGNISLLAELYLCHLVKPKTMVECLRKLKESQAPESISSLILLLQTCGSELDQQSKNAVDQCFVRLKSLAKSGKLPSHQIFKIEELSDLRTRGWKKLASTQHSLVTLIPEIRKPEDKSRLSSIATIETKRKSIKPTTPVTPSNLAVNQQPYNSRVLKPPGDWSQGSGHLKPNTDGSTVQSQSNKAPATLLQNRFRDFSPSITQKSPSAVSLNALDDKMVEPPPVPSHIEDIASFVIAALISSEDPVLLFTKYEAQDRLMLLRAVLERVVERTFNERNNAGLALHQLLLKDVVTPDNLVHVCTQFLPTCDEDWLQDVPMGLRYIADIFQYLIQSGEDYLSTLIQLLKPLEPPKNGAVVLAHCLNSAASRLGTECVASKWRFLRLCWTRFGIPEDNVSSFVKSYAVQFTVESDDFQSVLQALTANAKSDYVLDLFRRLSVSQVPPDFVRTCTTTLVKQSADLPRTEIDDHVISLGILVDHNPDRELEVLCGLQDCASTAPTNQWLKSLLDKKVISSDAFDAWKKSAKGGQAITKDLPIRNP